MNSDLISRSELKSVLENECFWCANRDEPCDKPCWHCINEKIDNAPPVEPKLSDDQYEFLSTLMQSVMTTEQLKEVFQKMVEEKNRWIPVSERLPNRNGVYIVTRIIEGTRIIDASYFDGQNTWHRDVCVNHGRPYLNDVIAWQPRPEPYTKGGTDMRKPNCVTCDHFGKCEGCEKGDEE